MKLPALAIFTAFAVGIACGLNAEIADQSKSHTVVAVLLFSSLASLLIGIFFCESLVRGVRWGGDFVVLGTARCRGGSHSKATAASGSYFEFGECGED